MTNKYIWKCLKCSCHFASITKAEGIIIQEKKCPNCKSLNILTTIDRGMFIRKEILA